MGKNYDYHNNTPQAAYNIAGARLNGVSLVYAIIAITVTKPLRRFFIAKILAFCLLFGVLSP